ncbi:MAG: hypothetical protein II722_03890 [Ruminococcus sp.]|jgi:hypothetical protein|nr:hypothetical protein [Ruminococcus sp.]
MGRFDGAWEENSVKGPRVEIEGNKLTRLWMSAPVLETTFTTCEQDGKIIFDLEHKGLRNTGSLDPYAVIKECYFDGTALVFVDDYRFSGVSETRLFPTANSRYGNVALVDKEMLPALQGRWESKYTDLVFDGNKLGICGHGSQKADISIEIVTARTNGCDSGDVQILDKDPAKQCIGDYYSLCYRDGSITGCIQVCDADPMKIVFTKKA